MATALAACEEAAAAGQAILNKQGSALDAVEEAVRILESCPVLDAGRGSYPNEDGEIEMDAIIMDGQTLDMGAVGAVQLVLHPISLARRVMTDSAHTFLVAHGAERFAQQIGFPRCDIADLLVPEQAQEKQVEQPMGTVGAVAIDAQGNVAAATSTGGTRNKKAGRIGDSPLVGSGAYADNWSGAASATGHGEALMKVVISKQVCDLIASGLAAPMACEAAISILSRRVQGEGGIIAVDRNGNVGWAYNSSGMPYAFAVGQEAVQSGQ
jgi:beta-aspartyl-peptidase (threonine type)